MRLLLLAVVLVAACSAAGGLGAAAERVASGLPLPGDRAPALPALEWLQRGSFDAVRPMKGRLLTVIELFATWDPGSRAVLPLHDQLQAQLAAQGVRFLLVSEESPAAVKTYLDWAKLPHLAVACDERAALRGALLDPYSELPIPYAIIISGERPAEPGTVLWMGPVDLREDSYMTWYGGYSVSFDEVLPQVLAGRFDVAAAREVAAARADLIALRREMDVAKERDQYAALATRLLSGSWPAPSAPMRAGLLAAAAVELTKAPEATEDQLRLGYQATETALALGGAENPPALHAHARALFRRGDAAGAVATERKAMETMQRSGVLDFSYDAALAEYQQALPKETAAAEEAAPPPPPETITREQAGADLQALYDHLRVNYVAYDDTTWDLTRRGGSWKAYNQQYLTKIGARAEWPTRDFYGLLIEYLRIFRDQHLALHNTHNQWGREQSHLRPTRGLLPLFADVRVREANGRFVIAEGAAIGGTEVRGVPIARDPHDVVTDRPYLYRTLPSSPGGEAEYLLGEFVYPDAMQERLEITIRRSGAGADETLSLPLHRSRSAFSGEAKEPWSMTLDPVPIVAVRSMGGEGMADMPKTADQVRKSPLVVLDLRGDGGGSDDWGVQWCARLTSQDLSASYGGAAFYPGEEDPRRRWVASLSGRSDARARSETSLLAADPFSGKLAVLIDTGVGSAAECFTALTSQIPGAVVFGENSSGCMTYGNVGPYWDLPNSRLRVTYPHTKGVLAGRPFLEGVGFFPDFWLDTEDPVDAAVRYLEGE